ncbi:CaiB/BaiF CoA transferase family protein [Gordonia humi]|uniref:Crotonobetainyl-CoA:carnitine CoA-transferase CaiB-like acyl-CoA transferase n=1 Tax=Gordonia humi TaxID=686429 RepID=A0A840F1Y6_9ACTN|nr:CoA transferase [Gordonia humi]MBB4134340.1 crotonobetainyl-CoA:carnitine CoA-transferase CaiB-like acyl-CoA transferase [Gordonia humi]
MSTLPLDGVRVLDLSTVFMGPYATQVLAEWGADVIKVESPKGDQVRGIADDAGTGVGPVFVNANRGKRSIALDLKQPEATSILHRLVAEADLFVHNIRPPAAARLGITFEDLHAINPRLVHCGFRGYARGGPLADQPAYDDVIQASSGVATAQAVNGAEPAYWRSAAADKVIGLYGAAAACAALHARDVSGVGRAVEVPMLEGMASFMLLDRQGGWIPDPPTGPTGYVRTDSPNRRPYATKDGHLAVMVYADKHWTSFFDLIGRPELNDDPRFSDIRGRTAHVDDLYALLAEEMATRTTAEWSAAFASADIPHGPVNSIEDLFDDPQLSASDFFAPVEQPGLGSARLARPPIDHAAAGEEFERHTPRPAPLLGQHSQEILAELGYSADERRSLVAAGIVVATDVGVPTHR